MSSDYVRSPSALTQAAPFDHCGMPFGTSSLTKMLVPAGVIYHSDSELELLENLVGRSPPSNSQGAAKY